MTYCCVLFWQTTLNHCIYFFKLCEEIIKASLTKYKNNFTFLPTSLVKHWKYANSINYFVFLTYDSDLIFSCCVLLLLSVHYGKLMQEIDFCFCFWLAVIAVLLSVTVCGLWEASSRWRPWTIFLSLARQVSAKMSNVVVKRGHGQYKLWPCHMPQHPAIYIYLLMFRKSRRLCGVYMGLSCLGARFSKSHKKMGCVCGSQDNWLSIFNLWKPFRVHHLWSQNATVIDIFKLFTLVTLSWVDLIKKKCNLFHGKWLIFPQSAYFLYCCYRDCWKIFKS